MGVSYEFQVSSWQSIGNLEIVAAQEPNGGRLLPIAPQTLPIQTSSPLIACSISAFAQRLTWHWAGWLQQVVETSVPIVGSSSSGIYSAKRLYLNQLNLVELNHPTGSSFIRFIIPSYFAGWRCLAWEYVGTKSKIPTT